MGRLQQLRVLQLQHNQLRSLSDVERLRPCLNLCTLSLEHNPLLDGQLTHARARIVFTLRGLAELNGDGVLERERTDALTRFSQPEAELDALRESLEHEHERAQQELATARKRSQELEHSLQRAHQENAMLTHELEQRRRIGPSTHWLSTRVGHQHADQAAAGDDGWAERALREAEERIERQCEPLERQCEEHRLCTVEDAGRGLATGVDEPEPEAASESCHDSPIALEDPRVEGALVLPPMPDDSELECVHASLQQAVQGLLVASAACHATAAGGDATRQCDGDGEQREVVALSQPPYTPVQLHASRVQQLARYILDLAGAPANSMVLPSEPVDTKAPDTHELHTVAAPLERPPQNTDVHLVQQKQEMYALLKDLRAAATTQSRERCAVVSRLERVLAPQLQVDAPGATELRELLSAQLYCASSWPCVHPPDGGGEVGELAGEAPELSESALLGGMLAVITHQAQARRGPYPSLLPVSCHDYGNWNNAFEKLAGHDLRHTLTGALSS